MKTLIAIALAVVLVLLMVVPAMASDPAPTVTTSVTIDGANTPPTIKVKWEQSTVGGSTTYGTVLPPLVKCGTVTVDYYAVVTSTMNAGDVSNVFAWVFSPPNSPPPYSTPTSPLGDPYFKYEVDFTKVPAGTSGTYSAADVAKEIALVNAAAAAGALHFSNAFTLTEVVTELNKQTAALWHGSANLTYEQPGGLYKVQVFATVNNATTVDPLVNNFNYVPTCGIAIDFNALNYGPVNISTDVWRAGDLVFNPTDTAGYQGASPATIRNVGNVWADIEFWQSDMGFGKDSSGVWEVQYNYRMGNNTAYQITGATPNIVGGVLGTPYILPNLLALSSLDELDFSIHVLKAVPGKVNYTGVLVIGCSNEQFPSPLPAPFLAVTGFADPCP